MCSSSCSLTIYLLNSLGHLTCRFTHNLDFLDCVLTHGEVEFVPLSSYFLEIGSWIQRLGQTQVQSLYQNYKFSCVFSSESHNRPSLVAQWLRIHLSMQGTRVQTLVREDPTCHWATKPVSHNYWACALEAVSHNYWAHVPQLLKPTLLEPVLRNKRSHRNEKSMHCNEE